MTMFQLATKCRNRGLSIQSTSYVLYGRVGNQSWYTLKRKCQKQPSEQEIEWIKARAAIKGVMI
jgi:hypothetical protein